MLSHSVTYDLVESPKTPHLFDTHRNQCIVCYHALSAIIDGKCCPAVVPTSRATISRRAYDGCQERFHRSVFEVHQADLAGQASDLFRRPNSWLRHSRN